MITFRRLSAEGGGKLIRAYMREQQLEPTHDVRTEPGQHDEAGARLNNYYTGRDGRGAWRPDMGDRIIAALGIDVTGPPSDRDLERLFEAKRADNGEAWSDKGRPRKLSGIDFTASPHKSVTLAAEFAATPAEQAAIWQAIHLANDRAIRLVGSEIGWARKGKGGELGAEAGEVGWVSFRHYTARPTLHVQDGPDGTTRVAEVPMPGDPQAHIHNVVFNAVATESGHVGSLDSKRVTSVTAHLYGAYFQAELAAELRKLGIRTEYDSRSKAVVLSAIPAAVCNAFSKGRKQTIRNAHAYAKRQGLSWDSLSAEKKYGILQTAGLALRQKKYDGKNDREIWRDQAEELGWKHETVLEGAVPGSMSASARYEAAYAVAARLLADEFHTAAQIDRDMLRVHAAHGLIGAGIESVRDIDRVVDLIELRGIEVKGEQVALMTALVDGKVRISHTAQIRIEEQLAQQAAAAASDRRGALSIQALQQAIARSGLDFDSEPEHGAAQKAAIFAFGSGGRLSFLTGVAGAGKTTLLKPLVAAWQADTRYSTEGREVVGVATAWRQADALKDAGIKRRFALQPLLDAIERGEFEPTANTVLVVEEVSQIAPRPMLALLELQQRTGMTIKALGDREQCQAIEAGDTIEIMRRVLPKQAMPELLTTVRQETARQRQIAALFRGSGRPADLTVEDQKRYHLAQTTTAIGMKAEDGTLRLVGGDQEQVVAAIADLYMTRRDHLLASGATRGITVSALTNEDVADISGAIRSRLKERGEIGADELIYSAVDQDKRTYDLPLATGDKVRLFRKTAARVDGRHAFIGSNGDIVEIVGRLDDGLRLRNAKGEVGDVAWSRMLDSKTGRVLLGFGHALTIDAAQGVTSDEHINAMPRGSSGATAFKSYVAESRHRKQSWTMIAEGAVNEAVKHARALGDQEPITTADLYARVAEDMANRPYKSLATDLFNAIQDESEEATRNWILQEHAQQQAARQGRDAGAEVRERLRRDRLQQALAKHVVAIDQAMVRNTAALRDVSQNVTGHLERLRTDTVAMHNAMADARRRSGVDVTLGSRSGPSPG